LGKRWLAPLVTVYGVTRPLLPAALLEPAAWLPRALSIGRALGWYALLPLIIYGSITAWRARSPHDRRVLVWLAVFSWIWILVSSARGGGDGTDNPRYRVIFLVVMALLAAWSYAWARSRKDAWLGRLLAVEGVFLVFLTQWYVSRYIPNVYQLPFVWMFALIGLISAGILVGGWVWDRRRRVAGF
jgi:hypothetical protein